MPHDNFPDPYITCCFVTDTFLFVNIFHNASLTHYHFLYDSDTKFITNKVQLKLDTEGDNFPQKCFYSDTEKEIYTFYRQGQAIRVPIIDPDNPNKNMKYQFERITEKDLGQMFLFEERALIVNSSAKVLFFKRVADCRTGISKWKLYHTLQHKAIIFYQKGNIRINITTEDKIYFYLMNNEEYIPKLESVMFNYDRCSQILFGSLVRYGFTWRTGEKDFEILQRKYQHNFKVNVIKDNYAKSMGISVESMGKFFVSKINSISVFDSKTFVELPDEKIYVKLLESNSREKDQILSMAMCENEMTLAVITGKYMIRLEKKPSEIYIFRRISNNQMDRFIFYKQFLIQDNSELNDICMQFFFKITQDNSFSHKLIFAKINKIIEFDFENGKEGEIQTLYEYPKHQLTQQPIYFSTNDSQESYIISNKNESIFHSKLTNQTFDLDEWYNIQSIKQVYYDYEDQVFYIMANKFKEQLGLFIISLNENNPKNYHFLLKVKNKLDIADANIYVLKNEKENLKELVISYKTINTNAYNLTLMDISDPYSLNQNTVFRHESFQLWESECFGFLINETQCFVNLSKDGISVMNLSEKDKIILQGNDHQMKIVHSFQSVNYLKIDPNNFIEFDFTDEQNGYINVQQKHNITNQQSRDTETWFEKVFTLCIVTPTLRELLLLQSLQLLKTQIRIMEFVKEQPKPLVFFKSLLELDGSNFIQILSFDSRSMQILLSEDNKDIFEQKYPLFYKNKICKKNNSNKYYYRSAIDNALKNNQINALLSMIDYIVQYQNNYVSSFLFQKNLSKLILKGVQITPILQSKIFRMEFDYDEWVQTHTNHKEYLRPYNGSLFELREKYYQIFSEEEFQPINVETCESSRMYKISFSLNLLPQLCEHMIINENGKSVLKIPQNEFLSICGQSDELKMFETVSMKELIKFKWDQFSRQFQLFGFMMHCIYLLSINIYIQEIYMNGHEQHAQRYQIFMCAGLAYPLIYDTIQLVKLGFFQYFDDVWNFSDIIFIYSGLINIALNKIGGYSPYDIQCKIVMLIIILTSIFKTFFFLRIFSNLSYIVTMLVGVIRDLQVMFGFLLLLIFMYSNMFAVIGVANKNQPGHFQDYSNSTESEEDNFRPYAEYDGIGYFLGNIINTFRMSLGDFDFEALGHLDVTENYLYWFMWVIVIFSTLIVFINFIIAETSNSYQKVKQNLESSVEKERVDLIHETEIMSPKCLKFQQKFPRYIIRRSIEN